MPNWLKSRNARIAIGVAVLFLAAKWLFTPTLSDAYLAFNAPEVEDGNVADNTLDFWALVQPIVDMGLATLAGIGTVVLTLVQWAGNRFGAFQDDEKIEPVETPETTQAPSTEQLMTDLARAVASKDTAAEAQVRRELRRPYAMSELSQALEEGELSKVDGLVAELKAIHKGSADAKA